MDEEESRRIPTEYHPRASTAGLLVEEGSGRSDQLDFSRYRDGYDVRIIYGDIVETVRLGDRVGVYYKNFAIYMEAFGEDALEEAERREDMQDASHNIPTWLYASPKPTRF